MRHSIIDCCFQDNTVARDYVLPDFTTLRRGYMKSQEDSTGRPQVEGEQIIRMNNERFTVPEILFNPSDIGIQQVSQVCFVVSMRH